MGSLIADEDSECTRRFVTIDNEKPIPTPYPSECWKTDTHRRKNRNSRRDRLVHNHPSGDPTPSQADIRMTKAIIDIAGPLGIAVHDHIIVGKNGHASMKGLRLI